MKKMITKILMWFLRDEFWRLYGLETQVNNGRVEFLWRDKMNRSRIHAIERELGISNSFHHAELSHPDDGFKDFEHERKTWDFPCQPNKPEAK